MSDHLIGLPKTPDPTLSHTPAGHGNSTYWETRQTMLYYAYVEKILGALALNAKSLIDVGSRDTSISESCHWIPKIHALDIHKPYSSERVLGIKMDFFDFYPEEKYDFAICLQVLEHIPDARAFAQKLLSVARNVLVSVPFRWPESSCKHHCQDPVDDAKLLGWFGRKADYRIVVEEPLAPRRKSRRLIAYYHGNPARFSLKPFRRILRAGLPATPEAK